MKKDNENNINEPTLDMATKQLYLKLTMRFIKRAYREVKQEEKNEKLIKNIVSHEFGNNTIEGLSLLNTTIWACKNWSLSISNTSWRSYRSALLFSANLFLLEERIDEKTYNRIYKVLKATKGRDKKDVELRTSAKKQKHLSIKDLKKIDKELSKSKSIWAKPTRLWLRAGILTGLRPTEWRNAILSFEDNIIVLIVKNAKHTNNRGNGEVRHLNLSHLNENDINIIKNHLKIVEQFKDSKKTWNKLYNGCSNLLRVKNKKAFPTKQRTPTLYSARHQFSANSKASGCKPEELAALMGHATDLTAQMTYGKKSYGTKGKKPEIKMEELKTVRNHKKTMNYFDITQVNIKNRNNMSKHKNSNK